MTAPAYAADTKVSVEKSRAEIDSILAKHGATQRGVLCDDLAGKAIVAFVIGGHQYRLEVPLPLRTVGRTGDAPRNWWRMSVEQRERWLAVQHDQACRVRWRGVVLLLKGKLEIVRLGISTVEREFMADLVLPNGRTLGLELAGKLVELAKGEAPARLLGMGDAP